MPVGRELLVQPRRQPALQLLGLDLSIDLQPPQVAQQRSFLGGSRSLLQDLDAIGRALRQRRCGRGRRTGLKDGRQRRNGQQSDDLETAACDQCEGIGPLKYRSSTTGCRYSIDLVTRVLAIDVGGRRIGLAISDPSRDCAALSALTVSSAAKAPRRRDRAAQRDDVGCRRSWWGCQFGSTGRRAMRPRGFIDALRTHRSADCDR